MNYVGNKGGQTIAPQLINHIPSCNRYFSLFFGAGGLEKHTAFKNVNWLCAEINQANLKYQTSSAVIAYSTYHELIADNNFTSGDFLFCDPPYLFETRKSKSKYYNHEFNDSDHVEFLSTIRYLQAKIMITHPFCDLYKNMLVGWKVVPLDYYGYNGLVKDNIWMNYDSSKFPLNCHDYLGLSAMVRQQIKRKRNNIIKKIMALPFHQRTAIMAQLNSNHGS